MASIRLSYDWLFSIKGNIAVASSALAILCFILLFLCAQAMETTGEFVLCCVLISCGVLISCLTLGDIDSTFIDVLFAVASVSCLLISLVVLF